MFIKRVVFVWLLDLQLTVQSVPITTKVVSSNHTKGHRTSNYQTPFSDKYCINITYKLCA
jgi:hypothetical protein